MNTKKKSHEYYLKNRKKKIEYSEQYKKDNPEKVKEWQKKYRKTHLKLIWKYNKEYRRKNPEWWKRVQANYRHRKKAKLVMLKGGKCSRCGLEYNGKNLCVFQFHHKEEGNKFERGIGLFRKWDILVKEIKKCDLVCANCHFLIHYALAPELLK